jgi:hypothetical protein
MQNEVKLLKKSFHVILNYKNFDLKYIFNWEYLTELPIMITKWDESQYTCSHLSNLLVTAHTSLPNGRIVQTYI